MARLRPIEFRTGRKSLEFIHFCLCWRTWKTRLCEGSAMTLDSFKKIKLQKEKGIRLKVFDSVRDCSIMGSRQRKMNALYQEIDTGGRSGLGTERTKRTPLIMRSEH